MITYSMEWFRIRDPSGVQIKQEETLSEVDEKYHHCTHSAATSISHDLVYAFTDYRSQGQTLTAVIVDIVTPPTGKLLIPWQTQLTDNRWSESFQPVRCPLSQFRPIYNQDLARLRREHLQDTSESWVTGGDRSPSPVEWKKRWRNGQMRVEKAECPESLGEKDRLHDG